jgi:hypothetical protein
VALSIFIRHKAVLQNKEYFVGQFNIAQNRIPKKWKAMINALSYINLNEFSKINELSYINKIMIVFKNID